jgi:hypothetical protein
VNWSSVIEKEEIYSYLRETVLSVSTYELKFTHYFSGARNKNMSFSLKEVAVIKKFFAFMETEGSLLYSQELTTGPYPK